MNVASIIDKHVKERPEKIAIIINSTEQYTYKELSKEVYSFTHSLMKQGFQIGDRIALCLGNSMEFVVSYLSILRAGMVVVPLNPMLQKFELEYQLADSGAVALITAKRFARIFSEVPEGATSVRKVVQVTRNENNKINWSEIEIENNADSSFVSMSLENDAQITYTAAMDGYPLGAVLTHGSLHSNCIMCKKGMETCESDVYMSAIPLFHTYGAMATCLVPLDRGATIVLQPRFIPKDFLNALVDFNVSVVNGVPTLYAGLMAHEKFTATAFDTARLTIAGGSALPIEIYNAYLEAGIEIYQGYGLTECSPCVSFNPINGVNKPESVGIPLEGVQCKIVDADGQELPDNVDGEMIVKGSLNMKGYWNKPDKTAITIQDGWLYTGDIARRDSDGYYYITGRIKDMIITGGFNVYPKEVERYLLPHEAIESATVIGIPDLAQGEIVGARIKLKEGFSVTEKQISHFAKRSMALYKIPRKIEFIN